MNYIDDERIADIEAKAKVLIKMALDMGGNSREQVIENLFQVEPFNKYPSLKNKLLEG